ncbi:MAG: DNA translocase FtsK [Eubacterium sp.]|nr:DNA translocase FtsK [Eubacterium sp.]
MAAKKSTTGKRNSSTGTRKRTTTTAKRTGKTPRKNTKAYERQRALEREEAKTPPENLREIYAIVCFTLTLLLVLGTYGICGKAGLAASGFFFGLFGGTFYVLPIIFFIGYCFILANGPKRKLIKKLIWIFVLVLAVGCICQLVAGTKGVTVKSLYFDGFNNHRGGGVLFGGLVTLIAKVISRVGAVIVSIVLIIISIIMVTNVKIADIFGLIFNLNPGEVEKYDYDDDEYDDEDDISYEYKEPAKLNRNLEKKVASNKDILNDIRVLDKQGKSSAATKKKVRRKSNKIVPEEEIHEILPDVDLNDTHTATPKTYLPKAESEIMMPGDMGPRKAVSTAGTDLLSEINSVNALYNSGKPSDTIAPDYKPKDFFELELDPKTYDDPLGGPERYNDATGKVSPDYTGPKSKKEKTESVVTRQEVPKETVEPASAQTEEAEKVTRQDKEQATKEIGQEIEGHKEVKKQYVKPPMKLLKSGGRNGFSKTGSATVRETAIALKSSLESFGVNVTITNCSVGPAITRYELQPEQGVRVNKILSLENDIKLALAATDIRIEAPIPGKSSIGIEIPNKDKQSVYFRDLIDNDIYERFKSKLAFAVGKDISGQIIISDVAKMPHLLVAGATGSGKSVCINTLIMSILYKAGPEDVKMIMIDPKRVEFSMYNDIPHLLIPVVTDAKKAAGALNWAVDEMTKRYQLFEKYNVRNIEGFNKKVKSESPNDDPQFRHLPQIVVIVDELADLMMVAHKEVEDSIVRLCQLARAAGIHLIIATQRPSVDVITGLIKANVPSRIALSVSSAVDSRTIIDMNGAEKLLGNGDMLFYPTGYTKPIRVQGAYLSDDEILSVVNFIKSNYGETTYDETISQSIESSGAGGSSSDSGDSAGDGDRYDEYFDEAARFVIEKDRASIGYLQRMLRIGFNRAARIMDQLEEFGVVGPEEGTKPRKVLMTIDEFESALEAFGK